MHLTWRAGAADDKHYAVSSEQGYAHLFAPILGIIAEYSTKHCFL